MNKKRKILLSVYTLIVFIVGVLYVPVRSIWGNEGNIHRASHRQIWTLVEKNHVINGYRPIYELDYSRILISLLVISLMTGAMYLVLDDPKKSTKL